MITRQCAEGLHGFCHEDHETCGCVHHTRTCVRCHRTNLQKIYGDLCADCHRDDCLRRPTHVESCEKEGCARPGFRNPQTRRNEFFCLDHHRERGDYLAIAGTGGRELVADCLGADESDPRHEWHHVKSARYACAKCSARKWDPKLRDLQFRR